MSAFRKHARERERHEALIGELLAAPDQWQQLRPAIADAAAALWRSPTKREQAHAEIARRLWRDALSSNVLTEAAERPLVQVLAGLSLPMDFVTTDFDLLERAIVARANAARFPTPVKHPRVVQPRPGETVHLEFPAAIGKVRERRERSGPTWGITVPLGDHLAYTALMGEKQTVYREPIVVDRGHASITTERIVYVGPTRSLQIEWRDLLELRVKPHSVVLAGPAGLTDMITPSPHAIAAVIKLQSRQLATG